MTEDEALGIVSTMRTVWNLKLAQNERNAWVEALTEMPFEAARAHLNAHAKQHPHKPPTIAELQHSLSRIRQYEAQRNAPKPPRWEELNDKAIAEKIQKAKQILNGESEPIL